MSTQDSLTFSIQCRSQASERQQPIMTSANDAWRGGPRFAPLLQVAQPFRHQR